MSGDLGKINDSGDRVDWYSPVEGKAIAWKATEEEARFRALRYLSSTLENAAALSPQKSAIRENFVAAVRFPAGKSGSVPWENHVFLVHGKPVITFWGFVNLNENTREDVLYCLRAIDVPPVLPPAAEPEQEVVDEPLPEVTFARSDEPLLTPVIIERPQEPEPEPVAPVVVSEPQAPSPSPPLP